MLQYLERILMKMDKKLHIVFTHEKDKKLYNFIFKITDFF